MKINVTQGIRDYEGKPILTNKVDDKGNVVTDKDGRPVMVPEQLRTYFINALNNTLPNETLPAEDKAKIYMLSGKLFSGKEIDLTVHDRAFIKERVGLVYGPLVYGRICDILEGDNSNAEVPTEEKGNSSK